MTDDAIAQLMYAIRPLAWYASLLPKDVPDFMPMKADLTGSGDLTVGDIRAIADAFIGLPSINITSAVEDMRARCEAIAWTAPGDAETGTTIAQLIASLKSPT